ncbi:MAG: hypothetical protein J6S11_02510 [Bacteroidaceae bacterium]|nr:hypothetical protein [Bacteroidaceae bacterium]
MKRNYRNLFMVGLMAFVACFTGCKEVEGPTVDITVNGSEEFAEEIRSTSASFTIKTSGVETVAYLVEEGNVAESSKVAAVVYAEAEEDGRVVTVADNAPTTINVYSLEGGKEYTVFFVYTKDGKLVFKSKVFTTPAYDRLITVVESRKDGFKFHFNVPDTMHYKYALLPTEQYNSFRASRWADDVTFLSDGILLKGPQTIDYTSEQDWYEEGDGGFFIHPGSAFTLMIGQCDAEGNLLYEQNPNVDFGGEDDWGGEVWGPMAPATRAGEVKAPRMGAYTEEPWYTDDFYPTGLYARQNLLAALEMVESKVKLELIGKTERRIKIRCTADDDVQYVVAPFDKMSYNMLVSYVNEEAMPSTLLDYFGAERFSGTQNIELDENALGGLVEVDSTYIISVIGVYEEDGSVLSYDSIHVTLTKSTLPAAEVVITGCENPYGDPTPNLVWFNIKSVGETPVFAAKHIANYTKDVVKELSYGFTYADLITYYGGELSEEDVQAINSDEGLYLSLYSLEDAENTLIIATYNEEEGEAIYTGVSRAAALPAQPEVSSTLFEDLKGDWTARIIRIKSEYDYEIWDYVTSVDTTYSTITLGGDFDNSPETFDANHEAYEMVYNDYFMRALDKGASEDEAKVAAEKRVAEQFAEYKKMVTKYEEKYKGQNYILGLGLEEAHTFATPWDLFCSPEYSAYDAEELFYAYGPKLFFQVQQDGSLSLLGDANILSLPPVAAWGWYEFVLAGNNPDDSSIFYSGAFPVEVSDDKNTLVIKGVEEQGMKFYPAIGYQDWGLSYLEGGFQTIADIVLTRGAAEYESAATRTAAKIDVNKVAKSKNNRIKRTYLPADGLKVKTVKMSFVPVLDQIKEKYNAGLNK